ncbi:YraN family protein [Streptomyces albogriseolus]
MTVGAGGGADMDARQDRQVRDGQGAAQGRAARGEPRRGGRARGALGRYGETLAARRLTQAGMTVLARNWRCGRTGEIDIVARDGDALVVCEVKTRRATPFQHPMAAITPAKASRLRGLAERWLQQHGGAPPGGVRIDLVGVLLPLRGAPVVEHVRGVA